MCSPIDMCVFIQDLQSFIGLAYQGKDIVFKFILE
jgi:hypothetical protein